MNPDHLLVHHGHGNGSRMSGGALCRLLLSDVQHPFTLCYVLFTDLAKNIFNRPGVAGAVL